MNTDNRKIAIASDHGGYRLKHKYIVTLGEMGYEVIDMGTEDMTSCDYPDYAQKVARAVSNDESLRGVLVCGTGIGMSIAANKIDGIRAALCHDHYTAMMSRLHNDSNVLCVGARVVGDDVAVEIITTWLNTEFEGDRHERRVNKITDLEAL